MTEAGKTAKSTLWSHRDTLCTASDEFVAEGIRVRLMGATLELSFEASSPHSPGAAKSLAEKYVKALEDCLGLSLVLMTEEEWVARLHQAEVIEDMNVHSYRLHPLKGSRKGEWGVTVRANWRITFWFEEGDALDVNLEDYH